MIDLFGCLIFCSFEFASMIFLATYSPSLTGTALPIICSITVLLPSRLKLSGKVWIKLRSFVVHGRTFLPMGEVSPLWPGYPLGIGRFTPRMVGLGSSIEKIPLRL